MLRISTLLATLPGTARQGRCAPHVICLANHAGVTEKYFEMTCKKCPKGCCLVDRPLGQHVYFNCALIFSAVS
jgi:hypothetical protein